ncbi:MAG: histidine kinase dimerization/phospho-acceptor domain-containing protein [Pararobbsia sp.]
MRDLLARRLATRTLLPILSGALLLTLFVWFIVGHGLRSLHELSRRLAARSATDLAPIVMRAPDEIEPVIVALNGLLARLEESQMAQRTFIADAAHELRSPLAALKLQVQLAGSDAHDPAQKAHMSKIDARLTRTIHLAEQLLTLAREDAHENATPRLVDLRALVASVVGDLSIIAERKQVDLGAVGTMDEPLWVHAEPHGMQTLLWNLIDNAVRYTRRAATSMSRCAAVQRGRRGRGRCDRCDRRRRGHPRRRPRARLRPLLPRLGRHGHGQWPGPVDRAKGRRKNEARRLAREPRHGARAARDDPRLRDTLRPS